MDEIEKLQKKIEKFVQDRDWEQFHAPKNLSMALAVEAAELMELFQWDNLDESRIENINDKKLREAESEIADILIYALNFCNQTGIDPQKCVEKKIEVNEKKYPIDKAKGSSKKYHELKDLESK